MIDFYYALINPNVPFIRYALIAGIVSSITFGIIGSFVIVKRMSYIAGAVSHSVLGGIGLALFLGTVMNLTFVTPMLGAFVFAIISGLVISYAIISGKERLDTVIGTVWAVGMSIGLLFISITPGYVDPMSYLFGNILLLGKNDLVMISILNVVVIGVSVVFYNQLLSIAFDEEFARIRGLKTKLFQIMFILLVSLTVLLMITIVGIVMVIALLTIPPAISGLFTKKLKGMIILSIFLCGFFMSSGLFTSYILDLPASSVIVVFSGCAYIISLIIVRIIRKGRGLV